MTLCASFVGMPKNIVSMYYEIVLMQKKCQSGNPLENLKSVFHLLLGGLAVYKLGK